MWVPIKIDVAIAGCEVTAMSHLPGLRQHDLFIVAVEGIREIVCQGASVLACCDGSRRGHWTHCSSGTAPTTASP